MKNLISFMQNHCTKEEFIETMLEDDVCPGRMGLFPNPQQCGSRIGCDKCWEDALKDFKFLQDEENMIEALYKIDGYEPTYTVIDEMTITKEGDENGK